MVMVKVFNYTGEQIDVKEGNAGIYRIVKSIPGGGCDSIYVNEEATFREYLCVESRRRLQVKLTSDDCIDYESIIIGRVGDVPVWDKVASVRRKPGVISALATDATIGSWFGKIFKKKSTTQSVAGGAPQGGTSSAAGGAPQGGTSSV